MTTRAFFPRGIEALLAASLIALPACSPSSPDPSSCGAPHATFHLVVEAEHGPVPSDIVINVEYGSGQEVFDADDPDDTPQAVFCKLEFEGTQVDASTGDEDASDDGDASDLDAQRDGPGGPRGDAGPNRTVSRVVCDLWTDGAANVRITASGYPEVERELAAERDDCGIVMTDVEITLERPD